MQTDINNIFGTVGTSADNLYTFFIWGTVGLVVFAFLYLYFNFKKVKEGGKPKGSFIPYIKWALLFASAGFNIFFTYYVFLPAGQSLALAMAFVMGGVNLAEAYLIRLAIASWRHRLGIIFKITLFLIIPLFAYSLMSAGSSFATMMNKNKDSMQASQLELSASNDRLNVAQAKLKEVQAGEQGGQILNALQTTAVRNSRGVRVSFGKIKSSCENGGYYAQNYPQLCHQYIGLRNGSFKAGDVARAEQQASKKSAEEKLKMAQILKDRPPEIMPTLLGFALGFTFVGFVVSLALESAIVGVGFFEEIFINPTVLPANISFLDKKLDWNEKEIIQKGLQIDTTPSPHISFNTSQIASPFSSVNQIKEPDFSLPEKLYLVSVNGELRGTKKGQSARQIVKFIEDQIKEHNRLDEFIGTELKAENKKDKRDVSYLIITHPTPDKRNVSDTPIFPTPKKEETAVNTPKKERSKNTPKTDRIGGVGRSKRKKETADTGTKGENAHRYRAIKKEVKAGILTPRFDDIKAFKYGGRGMGSETAMTYIKALKRDHLA